MGLLALVPMGAKTLAVIQKGSADDRARRKAASAGGHFN
jgi:hypothetical protein